MNKFHIRKNLRFLLKFIPFNLVCSSLQEPNINSVSIFYQTEDWFMLELELMFKQRPNLSLDYFIVVLRRRINSN